MNHIIKKSLSFMMKYHLNALIFLITIYVCSGRFEDEFTVIHEFDERTSSFSNNNEVLPHKAYLRPIESNLRELKKNKNTNGEKNSQNFSIPSSKPTRLPSSNPILSPSSFPSLAPSYHPSQVPTHVASSFPSPLPSQGNPTNVPANVPSKNAVQKNTKKQFISSHSSHKPTEEPSSQITLSPSKDPSLSPSTSYLTNNPSEFNTVITGVPKSFHESKESGGDLSEMIIEETSKSGSSMTGLKVQCDSNLGKSPYEIIIHFSYSLEILKGESMTKVIDSIETSLTKLLASSFLNCPTSNRRGRNLSSKEKDNIYSEIDSFPIDVVSNSKICQTRFTDNSISTCSVIDGYIALHSSTNQPKLEKIYRFIQDSFRNGEATRSVKTVIFDTSYLEPKSNFENEYIVSKTQSATTNSDNDVSPNNAFGNITLLIVLICILVGTAFMLFVARRKFQQLDNNVFINHNYPRNPANGQTYPKKEPTQVCAKEEHNFEVNTVIQQHSISPSISDIGCLSAHNDGYIPTYERSVAFCDDSKQDTTLNQNYDSNIPNAERSNGIRDHNIGRINQSIISLTDDDSLFSAFDHSFSSSESGRNKSANIHGICIS